MMKNALVPYAEIEVGSRFKWKGALWTKTSETNAIIDGWDQCETFQGHEKIHVFFETSMHPDDNNWFQ